MKTFATDKKTSVIIILKPIKSKIELAEYFFITVARYNFTGPIPTKFEHKLSRHKQSFEKIAATVVLDKDENLL